MTPWAALPPCPETVSQGQRGFVAVLARRLGLAAGGAV